MIVDNGTLPTSKGTLYTCVNAHGMRLQALSLVNTGGVAATVNVYVVSDGSNSRNLSPNNLVLDPGDRALWRDEMLLETSDYVEGVTSSGSTVEWDLAGLELSAGSEEF